MSAEVLVLEPKCRPQCRFLVPQDNEMKEQPHQRSVHEQADIAEQQPLAGDRQHVRDVDRVSHVAIKSSNYEMPRREDGRGCAEPLECKASERIEQDETSRDD